MEDSIAQEREDSDLPDRTEEESEFDFSGEERDLLVEEKSNDLDILNDVLLSKDDESLENAIYFDSNEEDSEELGEEAKETATDEQLFEFKIDETVQYIFGDLGLEDNSDAHISDSSCPRDSVDARLSLSKAEQFEFKIDGTVQNACGDPVLQHYLAEYKEDTICPGDYFDAPFCLSKVNCLPIGPNETVINPTLKVLHQSLMDVIGRGKQGWFQWAGTEQEIIEIFKTGGQKKVNLREGDSNLFKPLPRKIGLQNGVNVSKFRHPKHSYRCDAYECKFAHCIRNGEPGTKLWVLRFWSDAKLRVKEPKRKASSVTTSSSEVDEHNSYKKSIMRCVEQLLSLLVFN